MDIRKILNIITEAQKPLAKGMKTMTLTQFLKQNGVEPQKTEIDEAPVSGKLPQKFKRGDIVYIGQLASNQSHFPQNCPALVMSSYKDEFGSEDEMYADYDDDFEKGDIDIHIGRRDSNVTAPRYTLYVLGDEEVGENAWYDEDDLKIIPNNLTANQIQTLFKNVNWFEVSKSVRERLTNYFKGKLNISKLISVKESMMQEAEKLGGVTSRKLEKEELIKYLDRILGKSKEKTDKYKLPYIHSGNIPIVNHEGKKYDLEKLANLFSQRPTKILKQNEKMQHSDGSASQFYNVGLPALKGLALDEDTGEFIVIDTCPGAGQCKLVCFAMKGGYVQWKASSLGQTRLLNFLYNDPNGFMDMLAKEIAFHEEKNNKKNIKTIIRWHDAGDFFSAEYLDKSYQLARKFPKVDFYAYTKIADVAKNPKPNNFIINFSMGAMPKQEKQIDYEAVKHSKIVPKEVFNDLVMREQVPTGKVNKKTGEKETKSVMKYKSKQAIKTLKQRIGIKYSVDPESILTYDEMKRTPTNKEPNKYNVIVKPGDGDESANRRDVLGTYLLIH